MTVGCVSKLLEEKKVISSGPRKKALDTISYLTTFALLIIACIGAAGHLPGLTIGWVATGAGGGMFLLNLAYGKLKERKLSILMSTAISFSIIVFGILGITGVLSGVSVGWGIIGASLTISVITTPASCYIGCKIGSKIMKGSIQNDDNNSSSNSDNDEKKVDEQDEL